jgi:hypothetical protein
MSCTYVTALKLDPNVPVHSLRVTALTTARERRFDIMAWFKTGVFRVTVRTMSVP